MNVPTLSDGQPVPECRHSDEHRRICTAREQLNSGNHAAAEALLRQILDESTGYRDEAICMLAATSWELGKWEEADRLFDLQFNGRASLLGSLTREAIGTNRDGAERLLRKHFEGCEQLM